MADIPKIPAAYFDLDPAHDGIDPFGHEMFQDVLRTKYCQADETTMADVIERVTRALYNGDIEPDLETRIVQHDMAYEAISKGLLMPGGRILAGAGTGNNVTLMNCYVMDRLPDSMKGIFRVLTESALTMQQGGGIGLDFTPIRPQGAWVRGVNAEASGPLPFMDSWDAMCKTIMSAGTRRGAMMATMRCDHPDIMNFIEAKRTPGRLTMFNVSVLVTDEFMHAVKMGASWDLRHLVPPKDTVLKKQSTSADHIYRTVDARELWELITRSTYDHAEPGVIFIDRINSKNNLHYCEDIQATNPCGEQPLPPYGACDLGAINLSRLVRKPFTPDAVIDWGMLNLLVGVGVRMLDNVIDVTNYPLDAQESEQKNKRRLGLGIAGLSDMLFQLGYAYGSPIAVKVTEQVMRYIRDSAYTASVSLAEERSPFPYFEVDNYLKGEFISELPEQIQQSIRESGIRNALLLTIAPTGTTALIFGNISSGGEPTFAFVQDRNVLQTNNVYKKYFNVPSYARAIWETVNPDLILPEYAVTAADVSIEEHLLMQAACQKYIDSSISKTINMPEETTFEEFQHVYTRAYELGLKGCTTYRPNGIRGVILEDASKRAEVVSDEDEIVATKPEERSYTMAGCTYKIVWPSWTSAIYITLNDEEGLIREIFIHSKDARYQEWTTAMSVLVSAIMKRVDNPEFIARELTQLQSTHDTAWIDGTFHGSLVAKIGEVLLTHMEKLKDSNVESPPKVLVDVSTVDSAQPAYLDATPMGEPCPKCQAPAVVHVDGCKKCQSCDYSECG